MNVTFDTVEFYRSAEDTADIVAYFPNLAWDTQGNKTCYQHIGQHSGCSSDWIKGALKATMKEARPLIIELLRYGPNGYDLEIKHSSGKTIHLISEHRYKVIRAAIDKGTVFFKSLGKNWLSAEEQTKQTEIQGMEVTNEMRSWVETYEFIANPPAKYFIYVSDKNQSVTTWTGDFLGVCRFGNEYRNNMGDKRQSVIIYGINGISYYGTYFKSSGDYARIKAHKHQ